MAMKVDKMFIEVQIKKCYFPNLNKGPLLK
jgi:hypothetical protein